MGNQNKVVVKKQGFSLLSFFLGILLGIILVLGSVVGVAYRALTYDLDKVLDAAGVKNKDENGDNIYINTDTDEGGVKNMLELISRISSLASNSKDLTLGQIDALIPAAGGLVKQIVNSMNEYVEIDVEELSGVRFSEFSAYFTELVLDIRPGAIVGKMGTGELNSLVKLLLYGVECRYVTDEGVKYPLYYDVFTMNGTLEREDGVKLPVSEEYAYEEPDGIHFGVYIYSVGDGWYVAEKTDEGFIPTGLVYSVYSEEYAMATGNYYKDGEETVYNDPITIRSLIGTDGMGALGKVLLADLIGEMSGENNMMIVEKILGGITLNDLLNGNIDLESTIHNIKIGDIVPANGNKILETLGDYTIGNLSEAMDELKIGSLIDIPADNALLVYLGYGVTGVELPEDGEIPDGEYSAKFNIDDETYKEAKVVVEGGIVISAYYIEGGETRYLGTTLNEISGRIDDLTKNVPIGDIIDVGDSALLKSLPNTHSAISLRRLIR